MQPKLEHTLQNLHEFLEQEREALLLGLVNEAVSLHDQKNIAIRDFELALRSQSPETLTLPLRTRIQKLLKIAEENMQFLQTMRHGVNRLISRINHLDDGAKVGTYSADGQKLVFSQAPEINEQRCE